MAAPIRIGILDDMAGGPPGVADVERWLRLAADECIAAGRIDRDVEFVHAWGLGLPTGTAAAVERAYHELVAQDVLMIVGPAIGDNALVATPLTDMHRVPTLNWAGTERARGDYMFHLQVGSHEDEPVIIARHLAARGLRRIGVVYDRSPIGMRYRRFLEAETAATGLEIAAAIPVAPLAQQAPEGMPRMLESGIDAVVYLGLGVAAQAVAQAVAAPGWRGPCVMNTAGIGGYAPAFAESVDGWMYVDMHSDANATLAALRQRPATPASTALAAAKGYDLGRLVAEGLARAPELTREGVKDGLEQVKCLPAAEGHEGTMLGFGHHDRGALHGSYLVMRQWVRGQTVEV